jgi:hypothetical protein
VWCRRALLWRPAIHSVARVTVLAKHRHPWFVAWSNGQQAARVQAMRDCSSHRFAADLRLTPCDSNIDEGRADDLHRPASSHRRPMLTA